MDERPGRQVLRRPSAEELEEVLWSSEEELVAIFEHYRVHDEAATDLLTDAALAVGLEPVAPGSLRETFLATVEQAARRHWVELDPTEEDDVVH